MNLNLGNDESERPQAWSTEACWPVHRGQPHHRSFQISDELWEVLAPLIPKRVNTHRFGGGRPRVPDRTCANGIFYVLRTGCQWKALDATGIRCDRSQHGGLSRCLASHGGNLTASEMAHPITRRSRHSDFQHPGLVSQIVEYLRAVNQSPSYLKRTSPSPQAASRISRVATDVGVTM